MNILKWLHTRLTTREVCPREEAKWTCRYTKACQAAHYRVPR